MPTGITEAQLNDMFVTCAEIARQIGRPNNYAVPVMTRYGKKPVLIAQRPHFYRVDMVEVVAKYLYDEMKRAA